MAKNKWKQRERLIINEEQPAVEQQEAPVAEELLVEFDAWFASRASKIPTQHHKEILKADFKARGLGQMASLEQYDDALKRYGVKLA